MAFGAVKEAVRCKRSSWSSSPVMIFMKHPQTVVADAMNIIIWSWSQLACSTDVIDTCGVLPAECCVCRYMPLYTTTPLWRGVWRVVGLNELFVVW